MAITSYALTEPYARASRRGAVTRLLEDERWLALVLLLPTVLLLVVFIAYPFIKGVELSVTDARVGVPGSFVAVGCAFFGAERSVKERSGSGTDDRPDPEQPQLVQRPSLPEQSRKSVPMNSAMNLRAPSFADVGRLSRETDGVYSLETARRRPCWIARASSISRSAWRVSRSNSRGSL